MSDIVEWLRESGSLRNTRAADEIERLREQLVKANAEIEALKHDIERHIKIASDALTDDLGK